MGYHNKALGAPGQCSGAELPEARKFAAIRPGGSCGTRGLPTQVPIAVGTSCVWGRGERERGMSFYLSLER